MVDIRNPSPIYSGFVRASFAHMTRMMLLLCEHNDAQHSTVYTINDKCTTREIVKRPGSLIWFSTTAPYSSIPGTW